MNDKEIAMNILITAMKSYSVGPEDSEKETMIDAICAAYKQIYEAVLGDFHLNVRSS